MAVRVIPRLDIKGPNLVKGIHLEGLRVSGPPEAFARHYYETGADELLYMDAVASLYGRNSLTEIIERTARTIFIPLTVGGGLRSLEDMHAVLRVGADKVSLNTAAVERPAIIAEAARKFGSSTITVSIEAKRHPDGRYTAYVDNGRDDTGRDVEDWAHEIEALGAGEIIVTSVDREGTGQGYDAELTRRVAMAVSIPVIACGGGGTAADVATVATDGAADAVSCASILHYAYAHARAEEGRPAGSGGEFVILAEKIGQDTVTGATIAELKARLAAAGVDCRP